MELIPIIKYALTVVTILSVVIIAVSYIMYKIKNSNKTSDADSGYSLVPAGNNNLTQNLPVNNLFDEKIYSKKVSVLQVKNEKPKQPSVKKSVKRFMVINENNTPYRFNSERLAQGALNIAESTNSRQGLNIYNNYSQNSAEPLKKFSL